jgi:hypothetical protein
LNIIYYNKGHFIKILLSIIALFIIFFTGVIYTVTSTSIPFKAIAKALNGLDGITIEGVDGSLTSGFQVKKVLFTEKEDGSQFQIEGLIVNYSLEEIDGAKKLINIKKINVDKLVLIGGETTKVTKTSNSKKMKKDKKNSSKNNLFEEFDLVVDEISIKNVTIKENINSNGFILDQFILEKLFLNQNSFMFNKLEIVSNVLNMIGTARRSNTGITKIDITGVIGEQIINKLIRDLPFRLKMTVDGFNEMDIDFNLFDERIKLSLHSNELGFIEFNDMDLTQNFRYDWPITWLDGKATLPMLSNKLKSPFKSEGIIQFKRNNIKYSVIENSYSIYKKNSNESSFSLIAEDTNKLKVKVEAIKNSNGHSDLIITDL